VHLHLFQHQLSPSILDVLKKYEIPAVYTAHDLKMLCLNYKMMHHGKVCEECRGGKYYNCAKNRCVKDSFAKSCINVAEGYLHKWRKSYDAIGAIITPSAFYRKMFRRFGIAPERVTHIPNFLDSQEPYVYPMADSKQYYLYLGRLSEEKGLMTLLQAVRNQPIRLRIAGTGPMEEELNAYIQRHRMYNVHMMGFQSGQALTDLIGNAKAVVLPSEWYENGPYAAIEALQLGRPIIGADIGGIPELVEGNGYLFESGSAEDLQRVLLWMDELTADNYAKLELASRELFRRNYTEESHYRALQKVYASVGVKLD
jgi:glycosyltransferase involved in cell wall biosynthesis